MSIQKQFIFSHAAMIVMPVIFIVLIMILVNFFLLDDTGWGFGWEGDTKQGEEVYQKLIKKASLDKEGLLDKNYLNSISNQQETDSLYIVVRKGTEYIYSDKGIENIKLPSNSTEELKRWGTWFNNHRYFIKRYDFYFDSDEEGSIFMLREGSSFAKNARIFFLIAFFSLILALVLTNVVLSYFMSKRVLNPIQKISVAAENIKQGNLNFTMDAAGRDELSQLINTFESMRVQLKESIRLREKYEQNRRELIANISHDLKTPITSILGYIEGIQEGVAGDPKKHKQYLDMINSKATYMNQLIEELALLSRLDVNRESFQFENVNISRFMSDYMDEIEDDIRERGIQLIINDTVSDSFIDIDRNKIIRVLENIITNSVKYLNNRNGDISIYLTDNEKLVEIAITDNGPGVPEEYLTSIFSRFYRLDASRSHEGSGLGLAISKKIIEAHGGTIWAKNNPSGGLTIHFTLEKKDDENE
ncbi:sensor histidine kinase [Mammaliicoccus sciuri]|uniref:sensor histidine kinase n=1 Tax=Mammaliicoccus sciuri TaxID=1296 RepID=UPI002884FF87|nr:HAMP domain-containing sensor histidine kinase [Mammaliicoccus sciuri]MDT0696863.1 HAMP domain-containing sensor histidine kinase [Mammaliicoccus sciuri]